jgi:hypothetical protein
MFNPTLGASRKGAGSAAAAGLCVGAGEAPEGGGDAFWELLGVCGSAARPATKAPRHSANPIWAPNAKLLCLGTNLTSSRIPNLAALPLSLLAARLERETSAAKNENVKASIRLKRAPPENVSEQEMS